MQVVLVMFRSDGERRSFSVVRNMTVIGRREDCDLRIPVGEVSRKHCRLVLTDDGVRIEDLGSSNGTWVNGVRVQESELNPGDVVIVGPVQFVLQINGVPDDDSLVAPAPQAAPMGASESSLQGFDAPTIPPQSAANELTVDEEFQIEEPAVASDPAPHPATAAQDDEFPLDEEPLSTPDETPIEEFAIEEEPAPAAVAEDELQLPEFPAAATTPVEDEFEIPDLESPPESAATPAPKKDAADSDWDFVIEENEAETTPDEFKIDLDSSHQQPHG